MERQAAANEAKQKGWRRRGEGGGRSFDKNCLTKIGETGAVAARVQPSTCTFTLAIGGVCRWTWWLPYLPARIHTHTRQADSYTRSRENGIRFDLNSANRSIDFTAFKHPLAKRQSLGVVPVRVYVYVRDLRVRTRHWCACASRRGAGRSPAPCRRCGSNNNANWNQHRRENRRCSPSRFHARIPNTSNHSVFSIYRMLCDSNSFLWISVEALISESVYRKDIRRTRNTFWIVRLSLIMRKIDNFLIFLVTNLRDEQFLKYSPMFRVKTSTQGIPVWISEIAF